MKKKTKRKIIIMLLIIFTICTILYLVLSYKNNNYEIRCKDCFTSYYKPPEEEQKKQIYCETINCHNKNNPEIIIHNNIRRIEFIYNIVLIITLSSIIIVLTKKKKIY